MPKIIVQGPRLTADQVAIIAESWGIRFSRGSCFYHARLLQPSPDQTARAQMSHRFQCDINILPDDFAPGTVRLLVTDMDSTFIAIECIDEIADFIGAKAAVARITEAAMRGDIDFRSALEQRVALLKGVDQTVLQQVYEERLRVNPGAETLLAALRKAGIATALVSGGFTCFTERLKERFQFDFTLANTLEVAEGKLTGRVLGNIVDGAAKRDFLMKIRQRLHLRASQTVAVGDGANDLPMMGEAGLSIAYHAKPAVQRQAHAQINYCGLEGLLGLLNL